MAQTLLEGGYGAQKRLFLSLHPYINERPEGKAMRQAGLEKIGEIAKADSKNLEKLIKNKAYDIEIE